MVKPKPGLVASGRRRSAPVAAGRPNVDEVKDLSSESVWRILESIQDPEIPAVSLVDLGMIRSIGVQVGQVTVVMTPTFAGCPALQVMRLEIETRLLEAGAQQVAVKSSHSPPWSSDWITSQGRERLRAFGLAPPPLHGGNVETAIEQRAACPYCGSADTELKNDFGPTLCRSIYVCLNCRQPFEAFKPV